MFPFSILFRASPYHIAQLNIAIVAFCSEQAAKIEAANIQLRHEPKQGTSHKRMSEPHIMDGVNIQYI